MFGNGGRATGQHIGLGSGSSPEVNQFVCEFTQILAAEISTK